MPHVTVPDVPVLESFSASAAQTIFPFGFTFYNDGDIKVTKNGSVLTLTTDYTVAGTLGTDGGFEGGTITLLVGASLSDSIVISLNMPIARVTDFPVVGPFNVQQLNTQLDRNVSLIQQALLNIELSDTATVQTGAKASTYTVTAEDKNTIILLDSSGGTFTVNLPPVASVGNGFAFTLRMAAGTNFVTVDPDASEAIDGVVFVRIQGINTSMRVVSTGTTWLTFHNGFIGSTGINLVGAGSINAESTLSLAATGVEHLRLTPTQLQVNPLSLTGTDLIVKGVGFNVIETDLSTNKIGFGNKPLTGQVSIMTGPDNTLASDPQFNELVIMAASGGALVAGINLLADSGGATGIAFGDENDARRGLIRYDNVLDEMIIGVGPVSQEMLSFRTSEVVFNDSSQDVDLRIESNDEAQMVFVNGGLNTVGIGGPGIARLHVKEVALPATSFANATVVIEADKPEMGLTLLGRTSGAAKIVFGDDVDNRGILYHSFPDDILTLGSAGEVRITDETRITVIAQYSPSIGASLGVANTLTTRADGFVQIPFVIGNPTGVPVPTSGHVPMVWNSTNNTLHVYSTGAWRTV